MAAQFWKAILSDSPLPHKPVPRFLASFDSALSVLSNRNIIQATYGILNVLVATFNKLKINR